MGKHFFFWDQLVNQQSNGKKNIATPSRCGKSFPVCTNLNFFFNMNAFVPLFLSSVSYYSYKNYRVQLNVFRISILTHPTLIPKQHAHRRHRTRILFVGDVLRLANCIYGDEKKRTWLKLSMPFFLNEPQEQHFIQHCVKLYKKNGSEKEKKSIKNKKIKTP